MTPTLAALILVFALLLPTALPAGDLLPPTPGDLATTRVVADAPLPESLELSREPLSTSWPVRADRTLRDAGTLPARPSRSYWLEVTAADLREGVPLATLGSGALVRVNPRGPAAATLPGLEPRHLEITDPDGRRWTGGEAMDLLAKAGDLASTPFGETTVAFRLRAELGSGTFSLRASELTGEGGLFVVHVFDRGSDVSLRLTTDATTYLNGQHLVARAHLDGATIDDATVATIPARLTSPAGDLRTFELKPLEDGSWRGSLEVQAAADLPPGLWDLAIMVGGEWKGQNLIRGARTAFSVAVPTARLTGAAGDRFTSDGRSLLVELGVEVGSAGRYEVRGVLYGTDAAGELVPWIAGHAADWLEPGSRTLTLVFGHLERSILGPPFEVRHLRFQDQGRLAQLHRQERGLALGE